MNKIEYKTMMMHKVSVIKGSVINTVLFDTKALAEMYKNMMTEAGYTVSMNVWTWKTRIEL